MMAMIYLFYFFWSFWYLILLLLETAVYDHVFVWTEKMKNRSGNIDWESIWLINIFQEGYRR